VKVRGKVAVSSKYGIIPGARPGERSLLVDDTFEYDTVVDVYMTEFTESYLEFTEKGKYRYICE
jgi:hypothetical protein